MSADRMDIEEALVRHLQATNEILPVSFMFRKLEDSGKVDFVHNLLLESNLLPELTIDVKSTDKSTHFRKLGNEKFVEKIPKEAIELYTQSIAHAECKSKELSLAYANRSAVLFENGLYKECLEDINRAFKNNYPEDLKPKLEKRKSNALQLLSFQFHIECSTPVPSIADENRNPLIQCATQSVEIKSSPEQGRFIVASKNIEPGEIIAIEKPLYYILSAQWYTHCHQCLKLCYNLIPCDSCTLVLYCSADCQNAAKEYHRYECPILLTLRTIGMNKLDIITMKITFLVRDKYDQLDQYSLDEYDVYRSDRYLEIRNLVSNREKRILGDVFQKVATTAIIYHYVKKYTDFFNEENSVFEATFKELVFLHKQIAACNFHSITEIKSTDKSCEPDIIGSGAFSFLSLFNHSCSPNIVRYCHGLDEIVIALEPIKKGQQCFDNYGYHHAVMTKIERQAKLKKQYIFNCCCKACLKDYPLYLSMINNKEVISEEDIKFIFEKNVNEAKRIFEDVLKKIKKNKKVAPNKYLADLQETMKACYFVFESVKVPF